MCRWKAKEIKNSADSVHRKVPSTSPQHRKNPVERLRAR